MRIEILEVGRFSLRGIRSSIFWTFPSRVSLTMIDRFSSLHNFGNLIRAAVDGLDLPLR